MTHINTVNVDVNKLIYQLENTRLGTKASINSTSPLGSITPGKAESSPFKGVIKKGYKTATTLGELKMNKYPHIEFSRLTKYGAHRV